MSDTELLYYVDSYLRRFGARVVARQTVNGRLAVALDRTAFYPTGGGQPCDTGLLSGVPVVDVAADDGLVWHIVDGEIPDGEVTGEIAWDRRFDHMQQHTGQHVLSQAFIRTCDAETVAFHLGATASTIDLNRIDLGVEILSQVEGAVNAVVDAALRVTAGFVTESDLAKLPLRKPPKGFDQIRVVQVEGFDWSACGGTHVSDTAQIGLIKIVGAERRGPELRVSFLCGRRARADYSRLQTLAQSLAARFSVGQDEVPAAVDRLMAEHHATRKDLADLEGQWVESAADMLWASAQPRGQLRVVMQQVDYPLDRAKRLAQALRTRPGAVVMIGVRGEKPQLIFARADDVEVNAGALLREAVTVGGGRGGGRPDWAQGGVPTNEALDVALAAALAIVG